MEIGIYRTAGLIRESLRSVVWRGIRPSDGRAVVIKTPAPHVPSGETLTRFRNEWLICRMFSTPRIIEAIELVETARDVALVMDVDPTLRSLEQQLGVARPSLREAVALTLEILDGLCELHARGVVHKDINPSNLLTDAGLSRVVIIDFGLAAIVPRDLGQALVSARMEGTLGYMPPEQTGRINRPIDYRSDYYALGATLHWMLSGAAPFAEQRDRGARLHTLLTRRPPLLSERFEHVPLALAQIVAKLLSKDADERYQGSHGLRRDLQRCLDALDHGVEIEPFELATVDPCEQLRPHRRLYGRSAQLAQLREVVEGGADAARPRVALLHGPSGVGKSALVEALRRQLPEATLFASCKFDQFTQASPHAGAGEILRELLDQLGSSAHLSQAELRARIHDAVGPNAALLRNIVPGLDTLIGAGLAPPAVGPAEARERFTSTLRRFVDALLLPELSVVLFIDDVQWADAATLVTLEQLCLGPARDLTLVLATRPEGLEPGEGLARMREHLESAGSTATIIELGVLDLEAITALTRDLLDDAPGCDALAELLLERTQGVPLFVHQLLLTLHAEEAIDVDRQRGRWRVDLARARARGSSGDVIDFLLDQFDRLEPDARRILGVAACIGSRFDLDTLAAACGATTSEVGAVVWEAASLGYLRPLAARPRPQGSEYGFVHDRIQQAASDALDVDRARLHFELAERLEPRVHELDAGIEQLAHHIDQGLELIVSSAAPDRRRRFATICAEAGERAQSAAAYAHAITLYANARVLLEADPEPERERMLELLLAQAECLVMAGQSEAAEPLFARARELTRGGVELARFMLARVRLALVPGDAGRTLELVMEAAELFGLDLRRGGSQEWIAGLMGGLLGELAQADLDAIASAPALDDSEQRMVAQLVLDSTNAAYLIGDINLFSAMSVTLVRLGLEHGISDVTGLGFVQLALLVAAGLGDYEGARRYAKTGFTILERFPDSPLWGWADVTMGSTIQPWIEPLSPSVPVLEAAHTRLREVGLVNNAGFAKLTIAFNAFMIGAPLPRVLEHAEAACRYIAQIGDRPMWHGAHVYAEAARALTDPLARTTSAGPELIELEALEPSELNPTALFMIHTVRAFVHFARGDEPRLDAAIADCEPVLAAGTGLFPWAVFRVIRALRRSATLRSSDAATRAATLDDLDAILEWLARWEASCPANARPLHLLVRGARALAVGDRAEACLAYTQAADAAADVGFHNFEGLANERCAELYLELGDRRRAVGALEFAARAYSLWGAHPLLRRVHDRLRALGFGMSFVGAGSLRPDTETTITARTQTGAAHDLSTIVDMSLALSETLSLAGVIAQLLTSASEVAGADRSVLVLAHDGALAVHAERRGADPVRVFTPPVALSEAGELLALAPVRACVRRREAVIVDDATSDPLCRRDPFVQREGLRAALCLPIVKQSQLVGVLVLENRETPGAFAAQHLRVLATMSAQVAMSLDNARLFEALSEREAQWRALVDGARDTITIVDREHRVEFINHRDTALRELSGESAERLVEAGARQQLATAIDYVFETGDTSDLEHAREHPSGPRYLSTRLSPILRDGQVDRVTLISTDVTEQRELEDRLRQAQKMQAIGTLAGGVAHDFNNLLTIILGSCELGEFDLDELGLEPDARARETLRDIAEAARRASDLTRQLLAFSRKQVLQPKRFDLNGLVRNLAKMLERLISEDITLTLELWSDPCMVYVDPGQLEQVVLNLAVNARDAMPRGGELTISTRVALLRPDDARRGERLEPGSYVLLEVRDTGTGIPPGVLDKIFDPFFTTKAPGKGTGLGLSTVLGIVEQSGGQVRVDSGPGRGTTFEVAIPHDVGTSEASASSSMLGLIPGHETILLIEDDPAVRRVTANMLEGLGYELLVAEDLDSALVLARAAADIDLVLSDVVLPGADGPTVVAAVTKLHPGAAVLYTSGYTDDEIMRRGVTEGTVAFVHKPFTREQLSRALRRALRAARPELGHRS